MYPRDTIAAIATPPGSGGVGIVRVSGPEAEAILRRLCPKVPAAPESHRLYPSTVVDLSGRFLDRGLVVLMRGPRSFTGEDVAEFHCHGGALLLRTVLAAALVAGARGARPGEFTLRAFLNGKLDLAQAEAVADLIAARTDEAIRVASGQLQGVLSREVGDLRDEILRVAAELEVHIDFAEEDIGSLDRQSLTSRVQAAAERAAALARSFSWGRRLREGAKVALVGKPNVGKSSLLNRLLGTDRAIVTEVPGTTRDAIEEAADFCGIPVVLVDTAGLRESHEEVERLGMERTRRAIAEAELVLLVIDGSGRLDDEDRAAFDAARYKSRLLVVNKVDLPLRTEVSALLGEADRPPVFVSALTGEGLDALRRRVAAELAGEREPRRAGSEVIVTRERHYEALCAAQRCLEEAARALEQGLPPDIVAVDVMGALDHLGEIAGRTCPEAVLDRIFSEFCIGK